MLLGARRVRHGAPVEQDLARQVHLARSDARPRAVGIGLDAIAAHEREARQVGRERSAVEVADPFRGQPGRRETASRGRARPRRPPAAHPRPGRSPHRSPPPRPWAAGRRCAPSARGTAGSCIRAGPRAGARASRRRSSRRAATQPQRAPIGGVITRPGTRESGATDSGQEVTCASGAKRGTGESARASAPTRPAAAARAEQRIPRADAGRGRAPGIRAPRRRRSSTDAPAAKAATAPPRRAPPRRPRRRARGRARSPGEKRRASKPRPASAATPNELHASHFAGYRTRSSGGRLRSHAPGRPGRGEQDPERGEDREQQRQAAAMLLVKGRGRGDQHEGRQKERREIRPAEGSGREAGHRAGIAPRRPRPRRAPAAENAWRRSECRASSAMGTITQAARASPRPDAGGKAPQPDGARLRRMGLGKFLARAPGEGRRPARPSPRRSPGCRPWPADRRARRIRASPRGTGTPNAPAPRSPAGTPRRRSGSSTPRARRPFPRRRSRRAEERARVGHVLFLEEAPRAPGRDREVQQQEERARQGRGVEQEQEGRRIEDARLPVGEPGLPRSGERVPERDLPRAQALGRVELERIEEVALVPKRGRPPGQAAPGRARRGREQAPRPRRSRKGAVGRTARSDSKPFGAN